MSLPLSPLSLTGSGKTVAFCAPVLLHLKALRARARKAAQRAQQAQEQVQQGGGSKAGTPGKGALLPGSSKKAKKG